MERKINEGQFGTWTILEKLKRSNKHYCWKCQCVCGAIKIIYSLRSRFERCQNCNQDAATSDNLTDKTFNQWTVLRVDYSKGKKRWLCKCSCGTEHLRSTHALTSGSSTRCRNCSNKAMRLNGKMSYQRYFTIVQGAAARDIHFDEQLTRDYLEELYIKQRGLCAISGMPIKFANDSKTVKKGGDTASLDRIDSDKSYEIGNVQWVHKLVNIMKGRLDIDEFVKWCRQITAFHDKIENLQKPSDVTKGWLFGTRIN